MTASDEEILKLEKIKSEIRRHLPITIFQVKGRKSQIPNGKYKYRIDVSKLEMIECIRLYCQRGDVVNRPHLLAGYAIHEFGHHLKMSESPWHSEEEAWDAGKEYFIELCGKNILPLKFEELKKYSLWTYGIGEIDEEIIDDIERIDTRTATA